MDTAEHGAAKGEGDLVVVPFGLGVGPYGCLFGCYCYRGSGRYRRATQEVLLIAGRLELQAEAMRNQYAYRRRRSSR